MASKVTCTQEFRSFLKMTDVKAADDHFNENNFNLCERTGCT